MCDAFWRPRTRRTTYKGCKFSVHLCGQLVNPWFTRGLWVLPRVGAGPDRASGLQRGNIDEEAYHRLGRNVDKKIWGGRKNRRRDRGNGHAHRWERTGRRRWVGHPTYQKFEFVKESRGDVEPSEGWLRSISARIDTDWSHPAPVSTG